MGNKINFGHTPKKIGEKEAELIIAKYFEGDQDLTIGEKFFAIRGILLKFSKRIENVEGGIIALFGRDV